MLDEVYNPGLREAIKTYSAWPTIPQARLACPCCLGLLSLNAVGRQPPREALLTPAATQTSAAHNSCCGRPLQCAVSLSSYNKLEFETWFHSFLPAGVRGGRVCGRRRHCGVDVQQRCARLAWLLVIAAAGLAAEYSVLASLAGADPLPCFSAALSGRWPSAAHRRRRRLARVWPGFHRCDAKTCSPCIPSPFVLAAAGELKEALQKAGAVRS